MILNQSFVIILCITLIGINSAERIEILMSNVTTQKEDAYMCTTYKLSDDQKYITNIEPLTNADIAHHMFAFGCDKPASQSNSWNCGSYVCQGSKTILFAWGRNAPALKMPDDVAFKVGSDTPFKYIVVNIHYLKKVENDVSGLAITVSNKPRQYQAGIMLLVSGYIAIPANAKQYSSDFSCKYTGKNLNVFAFRVHAHAHGDVNSAYRIRNHEWVQLARGDPQWPQAFYPTDDLYDLKDGDAIVGRCSYHNDENKIIYAGATHADEMCNVYLMYYTDDTKDVMETCTGNTFPQLESILPAESIQKPLKPATFSKTNSDDSKLENIISHHDMEGSKMHDLNQKQPPKSLQYLLSNSDINADDYYDDIERSRSKGRPNKNPNDNYDYDESSIIDSLNNENNDDYSSLSDAASSSLLLAAALDKINGKTNENSYMKKLNNINSNKAISKIKNKINNLLPQSVTITKYTYVDTWYDKKEASFGQVGGIAINQKSENIVVFHRGSQIWQSDSFNSEYRFNTRKYSAIKSDTILVMNRNTGKVISRWGSNMFYMPHGLTVDSEGNIWVTDVGRHQVLKFAPNNTEKPILEVGELMVPGNDKKHFCQPADVAVLRNGDFFVADGYCNSRIVKFDRNGQFLVEWSSEDEKMPSHFFIPHSLALNEQQNLLCVADRENYRIQCFDLLGNNLIQIPSNFGPIYGVAFAANNASILYAINGYNSRLNDQFDKKVFLIDVKLGNVIGSINLNGEALTPHDLAVSDDASEIYVADLNPSAVFKYVLVNYKIDTRGKNGSKIVQKDKLKPVKDENFRTSMFIMTFLAVPLILVIIIALIVRLKNAGKIRDISLTSVGNGLETKHKELGKWISKTTNRKNRNGGFTRLNQNSDDEEAESLNRQKSNSDSESEDEIQLPTISKV